MATAEPVTPGTTRPGDPRCPRQVSHRVGALPVRVNRLVHRPRDLPLPVNQMPTRSADYSTSQQTPATADTPGEPPAQADGPKSTS